jgi:hypothetical protein
MGVGGASDRDYPGTARIYLPNHPEADTLWAYTFSRRCEGRKNCFEIGPGCEPPGIGLDEPTFIGVRIYCEPGSAVGPSYQEVVFNRAIRFYRAPEAIPQAFEPGSSSGGCFLGTVD